MRSLVMGLVVLFLGGSCCGPAESAEAGDVECSLGASAFTQGHLVDASEPTELALEGPGFFVVTAERGRFFTRDGSFRLADDGTFVHLRSGTRLRDGTAREGARARAPAELRVRALSVALLDAR